ncbi:MAG: carboxypeptidase-like regulatory domain-containing protein [Planctomycetota bacterium]
MANRFAIALLSGLGMAGGLDAQERGAAATPAGHADGVVLGHDGAPLVNVEVVASSDRRGADVLTRTRTDGDGMFVLRGLPANGCWVLATAPGLTRGLTRAWLSPSQPGDFVPLRLWQANTIRGRVVDPDGAPIAGAHVLGSKDHARFDGRFVGAETHTDPDGRFVLDGVPIGDFVVVAWAPGFAMQYRSFEATAPLDGIEVHLPRGGGTTLTVQVEGLPAERAASCRASILPLHDDTGLPMLSCIEDAALDGDGRIVLAGLMDAEWRVQLTAPGFTFAPRRQASRLGDTDVAMHFRAEPGEAIPPPHRLTPGPHDPIVRARIVDDDDTPIRGAHVELQVYRDGWHPPWSTVAHGIADRHGRAVLSRAAAQGSAMRLRVQGLFGFGIAELPHIASDDPRDAVVRVRPPGRVTGTVRGTDGAPLAGMRVRLRRDDLPTGETGGRHTSVPTDRQGRFVFVGVAAGGHRLTVDDRPGQAVDVPAGQVVEVDLVHHR